MTARDRLLDRAEIAFRQLHDLAAALAHEVMVVAFTAKAVGRLALVMADDVHEA